MINGKVTGHITLESMPNFFMSLKLAKNNSIEMNAHFSRTMGLMIREVDW